MRRFDGSQAWLGRSLGGSAASAGAVVAAALALVANGACGHAEPLMEGVLHKGELSIRVGPVPAGWQPLAVDGADLAYRDPAHQGSAMFDVTCERRDADAPLSVLTGHLIMGTTERAIQSEETLPFDGREALHTQMLAKLDGVPLRYDIYVMKKDGCVFDLVYVAPPADFTLGQADFERFARGLHAVSPPVRDELAPMAPMAPMAPIAPMGVGAPRDRAPSGSKPGDDP